MKPSEFVKGVKEIFNHEGGDLQKLLDRCVREEFDRAGKVADETHKANNGKRTVRLGKLAAQLHDDRILRSVAGNKARIETLKAIRNTQQTFSCMAAIPPPIS